MASARHRIVWLLVGCVIGEESVWQTSLQHLPSEDSHNSHVVVSPASPSGTIQIINGPVIAGESSIITPLGDMLIPLSTMLTRGLGVMIQAFERQQLPLTQEELEDFAESLASSADGDGQAVIDEFQKAWYHSHTKSGWHQAHGITFAKPHHDFHIEGGPDMTLALIDANTTAPRIVRANRTAPVEKRVASPVARAVALLGIASTISIMREKDIVDAVQLGKPLRDFADIEAPGEVKTEVVREFLASTSDTLPWLPLDGVIGTLPGFLVEKMGKSGEWLGTLASYWKSGAEVIDNVAGTVLKPILNKLSDSEKEDYTGRNGLVENVNVPGDGVTLKQPVVTGAGLLPENLYEDYPRYLMSESATSHRLLAEVDLSWREPAQLNLKNTNFNEMFAHQADLEPKKSAEHRLHNHRGLTEPQPLIQRVRKGNESEKPKNMHNADPKLLHRLLKRPEKPEKQGRVVEVSDEQRPQRDGVNHMIVGDDFDDEDELFNDADDDEALPKAAHNQARGLHRKHSGSARAPLRELQSLMDPARLINRVVANFVDGVEQYKPFTPTEPRSEDVVAYYDSVRQAVQRQKAQLDDYLRGVATMLGIDSEATESSDMAPVVSKDLPSYDPSDLDAEALQFYPISSAGGVGHAVTVRDLINTTLGSLGFFGKNGNAPRVLLYDMPPDEFIESSPEEMQGDYIYDFEDVGWADIRNGWSNVRSDLIGQIAGSVSDVSDSIHQNPFSAIVSSLVDGLVTSNPLADDDAPMSVRGSAAAMNQDDEGALQQRIAKSAASMLRHISSKVIKSGPHLHSPGPELELKQPDPDPVKKTSPHQEWWF